MVLAKMFGITVIVAASIRSAVGKDGVYIWRWNVLYHQLVRSKPLHRSILKWDPLVACCRAADDLRSGSDGKR